MLLNASKIIQFHTPRILNIFSGRGWVLQAMARKTRVNHYQLAKLLYFSIPVILQREIKQWGLLTQNLLHFHRLETRCKVNYNALVAQGVMKRKTAVLTWGYPSVPSTSPPTQTHLLDKKNSGSIIHTLNIWGSVTSARIAAVARPETAQKQGIDQNSFPPPLSRLLFVQQPIIYHTLGYMGQLWALERTGKLCKDRRVIGLSELVQ